MSSLSEYNCPSCGSGLEEIILKPSDFNCKARYRCIACLKEFLRPLGKEQYENFMGLPYLIETPLF